MANVLRVKRNAWNASGGNAAAPAADALEYGELAWENTTGTLYIGKQINSGEQLILKSYSRCISNCNWSNFIFYK